jgi:hypothetical protein
VRPVVPGQGRAGGSESDRPVSPARSRPESLACGSSKCSTNARNTTRSRFAQTSVMTGQHCEGLYSTSPAQRDAEKRESSHQRCPRSSPELLPLITLVDALRNAVRPLPGYSARLCDRSDAVPRLARIPSEGPALRQQRGGACADTRQTHSNVIETVEAGRRCHARSVNPC